MKYLDYPVLNHLSSTLSSHPSSELRVRVRFEAYSVKPIGRERKMFKEMEEAYMSGQEEMEEMSFSPEMREAGLSSCFGRLDEKESRKVHFLLVSTLNAAFPDHDFATLRPDHFTREPNATQVLAQLGGSLGSSPLPGSFQSSSLGHSPASPSFMLPDLYRALSDVVPLDECEVYSWFPEPEYDPHIDAEDGEASEDGFEEEEDVGDMEIEDPSWGQAGMELDDVPAPPPPPKVDEEEPERRAGSLLWSANYFFYSRWVKPLRRLHRRQKRILFLTCWCRKRPQHPADPSDQSSFPLPISASFSSPPSSSPLHHRRVNYSRVTRRRSKSNLKSMPNVTGTIPIRSFETPKPTRLATSAPSTFLATPSPSSALARMTAGGFRPKQTPARVLINAAREQPVVDLTEVDRVRKERSESTTPGPGVVGIMDAVGEKGKRVKV